MESEWKQESRHRNSEAVVKTVVYSQWNGEAGKVLRGVVARGNFCVNKIPLVSLLRIYRGAKAEAGRAVGRSLGSSRWGKLSVNLGDSRGGGENRWDSGWILPLSFYCENVQVYTEVSTHRITIWVLIDTWLYLPYYISIRFPTLCLCHRLVWSIPDSTSAKTVLQSPSVIMWSFALWDSHRHSKPRVGRTKLGANWALYLSTKSPLFQLHFSPLLSSPDGSTCWF